MRLVSVLAIVAALAACAPMARVPPIDSAALDAETETQKRLVVAQHLDETRQLHRIVYPMLAANAPLCGVRTAWGTGLIAETSDDQGRLFAAAARAAGLGSALTVVGVADGSPAARAGLVPGDRIVGVGNTALPVGRRAHDDFAILLDQFNGPEVTLTIERDGEHQGEERLALTLVRERVCAMPYRVTVSEAINAYANGRELTVTSGLLRFLGADADIAVIVGHEVAHNVMGHNSGAGAPGIAALYDFFGLGAKPRGAGADAPSQPITQAFEAEADYIGLYLMARAGFPIEGAPGVYRRFAVSAPSSIVARTSASHPSSPARVVMLGETVREIAAKRAQGLPLIPDTNGS